MKEIPPFYAALLSSAGPATLSVLSKDGSIQSGLVWPDYDGEFIKLNMLRGSPKERSIVREGRATLLVAHRTNENMYISVRCELHEITAVGAIEHLDMLTQRNMGLAQWYGRVEAEGSESQHRRVLVFLRPVRVYHT